MAKFFGNLHLVLAVGLVAAILVIVSFTGWTGADAKSVADDVFRWLHTFFGILWIGLLYYLNFVQVPTMPSIPAEQTGAINNHIAPKVFFFFRYAALLTVLTGLIVAGHNGYLVPALTFAGTGGVTLIGIGMWLALIMAFNVWFIIWPNQKKALGIVQVTPEEKAKAARLAMLISRTNTMLSLPMLYCMVAQQNSGL
jgi:uncharacterized membrane protein